MSEMDTTTILAVPCDQAVVLTNAQGEKIISEIKKKCKTKEEKERIAQDVKVLFTKPEKK